MICESEKIEWKVSPERKYEMDLCKELFWLNREISEYEEKVIELKGRKDQLIKELVDIRPDGGKFDGIDLKKTVRKGAVNTEWMYKYYGITEEDKESFRKPGIEFWTAKNY